jgi:hypothetical protein
MTGDTQQRVGKSEPKSKIRLKITPHSLKIRVVAGRDQGADSLAVVEVIAD